MDASPRTAVRLALAQQLAASCAADPRMPCAIEAVYCMTPSFADVPLAYGEGAVGARRFLLDVYAQRHREAREVFDRANAAAAAASAMRWMEVGGDPIVPSLVARALYADLLFLGQHVPDDVSAPGTPPDFVESLLSASGKPAIVVPHWGTFTTLGRQVLIAWKPTREAARAVSGAIPLLQRASGIHYVTELGNTNSGRELEAYLHAHRVEGRIQRHAPLGGDSAGDGLLSLAADLGADLLVMGCYSHSRARELVLGGVTRTVLRTMTLPVLMAR
jgi:nucleotide-binding universal stress UspA family protein